MINITIIETTIMSNKGRYRKIIDYIEQFINILYDFPKSFQLIILMSLSHKKFISTRKRKNFINCNKMFANALKC